MTLNELIAAMQGAWYEPAAAFLILLLAAYGIGCLLLEKLGCRKDAHPGSGLLALVAGLDLLAVVFRLGDYAVIHLPAGVLYGAAAVPAVYGACRLARRAAGFGRDEWVLWGGVLILAGITAAPAFVPPFSWDEQSYQVALMYRYLEQGSTAVVADNPYSALSSMPHFLMLWGVRLGGVNFPRLLVLGCCLIAVPWIYLLLLRFGRKTALVLTAAFLLSPLTGGMWREVYLEPFILLNLLAGAQAVRVFRGRLLPLALLTGFFAGMAAAVKLTGGAASLALLCLLRSGVRPGAAQAGRFRLCLVCGGGIGGGGSVLPAAAAGDRESVLSVRGGIYRPGRSGRRRGGLPFSAGNQPVRAGRHREFLLLVDYCRLPEGDL